MGGCCVGDCCVVDRPLGHLFGCCVVDIFGNHPDGCTVSSCGYHPGPSESEVHAKKIANELAAMKERSRESTEKFEEGIMDSLSSSLEGILDEIARINDTSYGGRSLNIDIAGIRRRNDELKRSVRGHIGNILDERLVLTDKELSVILQERDDKKRGKNFDDFCLRVQRQAVSSLREKIKRTVEEQSAMMNNAIRQRLGEVDNNMRETQLAYQDILRSKEQGDAKREENVAKHAYKYELCRRFLDELK